MLSRRDKDGAKVEEIGVRVIAVDFEDFGDESAARPSFDMDHDVERVTDVRLDGAVRQFHAALQDAARCAIAQTVFCWEKFEEARHSIFFNS